MSETARLADQIRRAFDGEAWHGDSLMEILAGANAKTAAAKPVPNAHSIWELWLHIAAVGWRDDPSSPGPCRATQRCRELSVSRRN